MSHHARSWGVPEQTESIDYRARATELLVRYRGTLEAFVESIAGICDNLTPGQKSISFSIAPDGNIKAMYGAIHIIFPKDVIVEKVTLSDWKNRFTLHIDGKEIPVADRIKAVQEETKKGVFERLLPGRVKGVQVPHIKSQIRIGHKIQK